MQKNKNIVNIVATAETASPQLEDGFTRIANELFDKIIDRGFGKVQMQVVLAVIRKTYGYQRKQSFLKKAYIAKMTGLHPSAVSRAVRELIEMDVLIDFHNKNIDFPEGTLGIQKDHLRWRDVTKLNTTIKRKSNDETSTSMMKRHKKHDETSHIKERKKPNLYIDEFVEFWSVYPKKQDKQEALKRFKLRLKEYSAEFIIECTKKFALDIELGGTEQQYIKLAATYLNKGSFIDYEDLTEEQIRAKHTLTKKDKPDNRPQWAKDKDLLDEQNEKRVSTHWQIEKKEETVYVTNPDKKQKNKAMFDKLANKHNFK